MLRREMLFALLAAVGVAPAGAFAELPEARTAEIQRLRQMLFERVEYPLAIRRLDTEIRLARLEWESLRRQVEELERLDRQGNKALIATLERGRLAAEFARLRVADLEEERSLRTRFLPVERRLRELEAGR